MSANDKALVAVIAGIAIVVMILLGNKTPEPDAPEQPVPVISIK